MAVLTLPLCSSCQGEQVLGRETGLNILLADDDKNFGLILKNELEAECHCVDLVSNGVEAVLSFIKNLYDFVLLDLRMPSEFKISSTLSATLR